MENIAEKVLFLKPEFKERPWGGERLRTEWGYDIKKEHIGECWAVSAHPGGDCTIAEGAYRGETLSKLWKEHPGLFRDPGATGAAEPDRFPLLIKIIDAKEDLSIQVHPDDSYAKEHENGSLGKSECWYILSATEGASLVVGHRAKTREELISMIRGGRWSELIREIPVKAGDFINIAPGTVHAIKGGIELLEIQESSDITYRLYDYDRIVDGKKRDLHIDKSIDVITVPAPSPEDSVTDAGSLPENRMNGLVDCDCFKVWKLHIEKPYHLIKNRDFMIVSVIDGKGSIEGHPIRKGDHFILTKKVSEADFTGKMTLILSA